MNLRNIAFKYFQFRVLITIYSILEVNKICKFFKLSVKLELVDRCPAGTCWKRGSMLACDGRMLAITANCHLVSHYLESTLISVWSLLFPKRKKCKGRRSFLCGFVT